MKKVKNIMQTTKRITQKQLEKDYNVKIEHKGKKYFLMGSEQNFKTVKELHEFLTTMINETVIIDETVNIDYDSFIRAIEQCADKDNLQSLIQKQIDSLQLAYPNIGTFSVKMSEYRKVLKSKLIADNIPDIFKNETKNGTEHLAITYTYKLVPRKKIDEMIADRNKKSDNKANTKHPITKNDIKEILGIAKLGIYQRDDVYFALASLELLTGRRFIENASLLNDFDSISNFKILVKHSEIAKKHKYTDELLEFYTLEFSQSIIDCILWIRDNFNVSDLSNDVITDRYLGSVNKRVKTYFSKCFKHDSDYATSHTLRAYSVNIAWYFYGDKSQHKASFIAKYLGHDDEKSTKEYDRYYVDETTFNRDEKQGYKKDLLENDDDIKLPFTDIIITPYELFKLEYHGIEKLIKSYENFIVETIDSTESEIDIVESEKPKKTTHFEVLKNCVDAIISYNEDKTFEDKIAITSRGLYELTGKRTPIISDFINNSEYSELIAKYNSENNFKQKQNMGKDIKKRLNF